VNNRHCVMDQFILTRSERGRSPPELRSDQISVFLPPLSPSSSLHQSTQCPANRQVLGACVDLLSHPHCTVGDVFKC